VSSEDDFEAGLVSSAFVASDFEASAFDLERRGVSALVSALASSRALAAASRSSVSLRAALSDAALSDAVVSSRDRLSAGGGSSARRGAGAGALDASLAASLEVSCGRLSLLLAAALLSTSAAKLLFAFEGSESGRPDLADAPRKDTFANASDVTLTTGVPRNETLAIP